MDEVVYKGTNRYEEFLSAARTISGKIFQIDGVVGILATGGVGRHFCDDLSDLDVIVYADEKCVKEIKKYIAVGFLRHKEISLDTPVESYQKALRAKSPSAYWSQVMRWDRENSQIMVDTEKRIENLLKEKLIFPDWEQKRILKHHCQEIEIHLMTHVELWEKRGDLINLADTLIRGTEHLILWIYAKNKKFQPYIPKWLFYYLENGLISESKYFNTVKKPYLEPTTSKAQVRELQDELLGVCEKVGVKFEYESVEEIFEKETRNWKKVSEKTRNYLGW